MSTPFALPWPNADIDIHPNPADGWHRVAVVGLWRDAKALRRNWPHAAVCGPLRTKRGIDTLVRGLLANPQIRVIIMVPPPGGISDLGVTDALLAIWSGARDLPAADHGISSDVLDPLFDQIRLVLPHQRTIATLQLRSTHRGIVPLDECLLPDRAGGVIVLPPPEPEPAEILPPGLPGQRVYGKTLADVWPRVVREVMRFGTVQPTQYGDTKELLTLCSVVEEPKRWDAWWRLTVACSRCDGDGLDPESVPSGPPCPECQGSGVGDPAAIHDVLGISYAQVADYYDNSFMSATTPEGQDYSYGSRMQTGPWWGPPRNGPNLEKVSADTVECRSCTAWVGTGVGQPPTMDKCPSCGAATDEAPDQIQALAGLLSESPSTRAAWVTPWRPAEDAGKESGRPCLVGAWFRATGDRDAGHDVPSETPTGSIVNAALHLTVVFRSHDVYGAYPLNLAACCRWLVETAAQQGMSVGTLTCLSLSAHVYDRDWNVARLAYRYLTKTWQQDPRSAWRVSATPAGGVRVCSDGKPVPIVYCAEAIAPDGASVLKVFKASTKARLLRDVQASGFVTTVEHALWLGAEIGRL